MVFARHHDSLRSPVPAPSLRKTAPVSNEEGEPPEAVEGKSLYGPLQTSKAFADHRGQHASNHNIPPFALPFPAS